MKILIKELSNKTWFGYGDVEVRPHEDPGCSRRSLAIIVTGQASADRRARRRHARLQTDMGLRDKWDGWEYAMPSHSRLICVFCSDHRNQVTFEGLEHVLQLGLRLVDFTARSTHCISNCLHAVQHIGVHF